MAVLLVFTTGGALAACVIGPKQDDPISARNDDPGPPDDGTGAVTDAGESDTGSADTEAPSDDATVTTPDVGPSGDGGDATPPSCDAPAGDAVGGDADDDADAPADAPVSCGDAALDALDALDGGG